MSTSLGIEYSLSRSSILHKKLQGSSKMPLIFNQNSSNVSLLFMGGEADVERPACSLSSIRRVLTFFHGFLTANFQLEQLLFLMIFFFHLPKGKKSVSRTKFTSIYNAKNVVKRKNFNRLTINIKTKADKLQYLLLYSSILFFNSGVISLVRNITRSHSLHAISFTAFVSSPSLPLRKGSLNSQRSLLRLVAQPNSAQLAPGIV